LFIANAFKLLTFNSLSLVEAFGASPLEYEQLMHNN